MATKSKKSTTKKAVAKKPAAKKPAAKKAMGKSAMKSTRGGLKAAPRAYTGALTSAFTDKSLTSDSFHHDMGSLSLDKGSLDSGTSPGKGRRIVRIGRGPGRPNT